MSKYHSFDDGQISETPIETKWTRSGRKRRQDRFIKGPISLDTIATAAKLPGAALPVYLLVKHRTDVTGSSSVTVPAKLRDEMGVDRKAYYRAADNLEAAGLVRVNRKPGRALRIAITTIS